MREEFIKWRNSPVRFGRHGLELCLIKQNGALYRRGDFRNHFQVHKRDDQFTVLDLATLTHHTHNGYTQTYIYIHI